MAKKYQYPCGCSFDLEQKDQLSSLVFDPSIENINLDCSRTWDLISDGNTKGIFQLESRLGRMMAKKLKPESIEQLSDLISIIRPGALDAIRDGKSVTNHYVDKKNQVESLDYFHPSLEPILNSTLGEMIYQEQAMQIAKDIAGFDLKEADNLRKIIGKKQVDKMAAMKSKFLEGCKKKNIVNDNEAEQIFSWIEKSQKYSFNKCLDPNSIVDTTEGLKTINEIKIGDKVLSPSDLDKDEYVEVIDIIDSGLKDVYEIVTESGDRLNCTLDHKILCEDGEMRPLYEILYYDYKIMVYSN